MTGPGRRVIGIIDRVTVAPTTAGVAGPRTIVPYSGSGPDAPPLVVPDTVEVGEAFSITATTYAPDGCWRAAGTDVRQQDLVLSIIAYDKDDHGPDVLCTMEAVRLPRTVTATFNTKGTALVKLTGRRIYESGEAPDTITLEKVVVVR